MFELKQIFMDRDEMTSEEANELIEEMRQRVIEGEDPEEILYEQSLEPDYIFDII